MLKVLFATIVLSIAAGAASNHFQQSPTTSTTLPYCSTHSPRVFDPASYTYVYVNCQP